MSSTSSATVIITHMVPMMDARCAEEMGLSLLSLHILGRQTAATRLSASHTPSRHQHRHGYKGNPIEDMEKAEWYLEKMLETMREMRK